MLEKRLHRLEQLAAAKPQMNEICTYYTQLYRLFAQAQPFLTIATISKDARLRQEQGFPLLAGEMLAVDPQSAQHFFRTMLAIMHEHGQQGQEELARLQQALEEDRLDLPQLLRAVMDRERKSLTTVAQQANVQSALLEYCLSTALGAGLERCRLTGLKTEVKNWGYGYCPICGGLPSIAELSGEEGHKQLHCSLCGNHWRFRRLACVHCGNEDSDSLAYFTAEGDPGYRVDICRKCSGYLKVVDCREQGEGLPLEIEDAATLHLDLLATREGFSRGKKETPGR